MYLVFFGFHLSNLFLLFCASILINKLLFSFCIPTFVLIIFQNINKVYVTKIEHDVVRTIRYGLRNYILSWAMGVTLTHYLSFVISPIIHQNIKVFYNVKLLSQLIHFKNNS